MPKCHIECQYKADRQLSNVFHQARSQVPVGTRIRCGQEGWCPSPSNFSQDRIGPSLCALVARTSAWNLSSDMVFTSCINCNIMPPAFSLSFSRFFRYTWISFIFAGACSKTSSPSLHTAGDKNSHTLVCGFVFKTSAMWSSSDDVTLRLTILSYRFLSKSACLNQMPTATCCTSTWSSFTPILNFNNLAKLDSSNSRT